MNVLSEQDPSHGAHLLSLGRETIVRNWEKQILKSLPAARRQTKSALRDHVPAMLDELAKTLASERMPTAARENATEHGRQRSFAAAYTLDQVLTEFQLLRRALFEVLEAERPLNRRCRDLILEYLEMAISESATEYVKVQFQHEQVARTAVEINARRLRGLHNVTEAALVSDVSLERLLNDLVERVRELFEADNAAILLVDPDRQYLEVRAASGLEAEVEKQPRVPVGKGMAGSIFQESKARIINDLSQIDVVNQILRSSVISALAAPLRLVSVPIGVVHVDMVKQHQFTRDDLTLLELVADRIAIVIQHTRLLEKQRENEARLRLISEMTPQILWTADPDGAVRYFNENWYSYTGWARPTSGSRWTELLEPEDRERAAAAWSRAQESGEYSIELRLRGADRQYRWFLVRAVPVRDGVGRITEWVGGAADIESQKRHQHELEEERELREQFVNTLTHDLRTPLTAAQMAAQMIARRPESAELVAQLAARVVNGLDRADRMIQDLLDVSRIRGGKQIPVSPEPCDLRLIAQDCADELKSVHGVRIAVDGPPHVHGNWSPNELRRALENLIGNAIKYGDPNQEITVTLRTNAASTVVEVHNWGDPIPSGEQDSLFRPFSRSKTATAGPQRGWGLGLLLVQGVARAHGGSVQVRSDAAHGTTFTLTLPTNAPASART